MFWKYKKYESKIRGKAAMFDRAQTYSEINATFLNTIKTIVFCFYFRMLPSPLGLMCIRRWLWTGWPDKGSGSGWSHRVGGWTLSQNIWGQASWLPTSLPSAASISNLTFPTLSSQHCTLLFILSPGLVAHFFHFALCKRSLICLESKSMTPHRGWLS